MKFLKLLDPYATALGSGLEVGEQQELAHRRFPDLVAVSHLHYWRRGDPIWADGARYLLGLAVAYDLTNLRLADVVNEALGKGVEYPIRVDVFSTYDWATSEDSLQYFPDFPLNQGYYPHPIVGVWGRGVFLRTIFGFEAMKHVLRAVRSPLSPE